MISALQPYPAYKPSGVPWLGDVPEHWDVFPIKRIASFKSGAGFPVDEQGDLESELPFLKVSDMTTPGNAVWMGAAANTVSRETAARLGAFVFPPGSIVFPKVGGALLTNKRRLLRRASCIDNNVMGCVVESGDLMFLFAVLRQLDLGRMAKPGPVPAIGEGEVREIKVAMPSKPTQLAIVRFLDYADRRIRRYIRAKERLIELLEEEKQAIIHGAVTRGLDPNVALKPSSPPASVGSVISQKIGKWSPSASDTCNALGKMLDSKTIYGTHSLRYLRNTDVQWNRINTDDLPVMDIAPDEYERYTVQKDDLLVVRRRRGRSRCHLGRRQSNLRLPEGPALITYTGRRRLTILGTCSTSFAWHLPEGPLSTVRRPPSLI